MKYDAVIFDLFGTLIDFYSDEDYRKINGDMGDMLGVPADSLLQVWLDGIEDRMLDRFGGMKKAIAHVCGVLGVDPGDDRLTEAEKMRLEVARKNIVPRPGVVGTITALKQMGMKTGLISDCSVDVPLVWPESAFAPLIDATVFSCCEKMAKPNPAMYMAACDRLSVAPERCLYVGDGGSHELTGARQVGMHPVLVRVGYDSYMDPWRPDVAGWDGPVISSIPEVLALVEGGNRGI